MRIECSAVRKKGSKERCTRPVVADHKFCSIHLRAKSPELWLGTEHDEQARIIQRVCRGWMVRKYLRLCGPHVLHRAPLANDEELVSCESKFTQYPIEFFSFEENDKVWWFDFDTIWKWCVKSPKPYNPYTKVPLSMETRKRLRMLWAYRKIHRMYISSESNVIEERIRNRWNLMCQVFEDNGFGEISPDQFLRMTAKDYYIVCQFVDNDLRVSMKKSSIYFRAFTRYLEMLIRNFRTITPVQYVLQASHIFLLMMCFPQDPYIPAFTLLSALYRM